MTARRRKREWPPWWNWEFVIVRHMRGRLFRRKFTEIELRRMIEHATGWERDCKEGRWVIKMRFRRRPWEVIVEPIPESNTLEVVTAYEVWDE